MTTIELKNKVWAAMSATKDLSCSVTLDDGTVLLVNGCYYGPGRPARYEDLEYVLVDGSCWAARCSDSPEKALEHMACYRSIRADWQAEEAQLKAFCEKYAETDDEEAFSVFSDWHKDVYGYRPHWGWTCNALRSPV